VHAAAAAAGTAALRRHFGQEPRIDLLEPLTTPEPTPQDGPLTAFWSAVRTLDPAADDESGLAGAREGHLARLFAEAGLDQAQATTLTVRVRHVSFEQWWEPFTLGVGPAGAYAASLTPQRRAELREQCRRLLPPGPVEVSATVWAVTCRT
jgi:hypothetical protein